MFEHKVGQPVGLRYSISSSVTLVGWSHSHISNATPSCLSLGGHRSSSTAWATFKSMQHPCPLLQAMRVTFAADRGQSQQVSHASWSQIRRVEAEWNMRFLLKSTNLLDHLLLLENSNIFQISSICTIVFLLCCRIRSYDAIKDRDLRHLWSACFHKPVISKQFQNARFTFGLVNFDNGGYESYGQLELCISKFTLTHEWF